MAATLVLSGVCLFALLIGDICCVPVQKGNDPAAYDDSYRHAAPSYDPQPGPRSGPGFGPQPGPGFGPQPGPGFGPQSGQGLAPPSGHYPLGSVSEGGSSPYYYPEMKPGYDQPSDWYVEPAWPGPMGKAPLAPAGVGSEYIRPPIPQPAYQGGELTHYEDSAEHGFYERESDEQGQFPHPPHIFASPKMVSSSMPHPLPPRPVLPQWGFYPYYYDYRFITGQYPPGTYTHASANFEHGRDAWQDVHYRQ
ncbi:proline-rich protein HaeIII subfamily 1-like isoform X4 [Takifugu flavidus]|uniref:proline-rich protein HaeIII subfamily 1-like isoform X4 n=1 Tax=Takifugu flavidus TaxID=433684 RepID=UPI0025441D09|nr:proline-rich protein HaeIII subfamily 1-like isoform X4 [Takifugu flavidus]